MKAEGQFASIASAAMPAANSLAAQTSTASTAAPAQASAAERMQPLIEAPAALPGSHNSITVKVAGETADTGIDLRFVERGGDIHLSVRTPSADIAQELRSGLNDLTSRLEHAGLRAEISTPAAAQSAFSDSSSSNSSSSHSQDDPGDTGRRGSGRNQGDPDSQQQGSRASNQSRWIRTMQNSGASTFATSNQEQTS